MKRAIIVASAASPHQNMWGESMREGLVRHGWLATIEAEPRPTDLLVLWGTRRELAIQRQKLKGEVCILERGYVSDRFKWTSISLGGGLNGHGVFRGPFDDPSRWDDNFKDLMKPWIDRDGYILIMGQVPTDMSLRGLNPHELWFGVAESFKTQGYNVVFRPHPLAQNVHVQGVRSLSPGPLSEALDGAKCVVTINSNSGVDAVLAGIPTISLDRRSMAWDVTEHTPRIPDPVDRSNWAAALAWKQWRDFEISSGLAWETLNAGTL
jgi:hypothetical protein